MLSLNDVAQKLAGVGLAVNLTTGANGAGIGPLIVALEGDYLGRERVLVISLLPQDEDDPMTLVHFRHIYPIVLGNTDPLPELIRSLFMLNRTLPIGHHGLCEETPGLYYDYIWAVAARSALPEDALRDVVGLIDYLTFWHGTLIDQAAKGEIDCGEVLEDLEERGARPRPLLVGAYAA